jgi:regulator of cell morphogenesis and NO signaling
MSTFEDISRGDTVGQLVARRPSRSRLFEQWGIDYCCGGKVTLAAACQKRGLDVEEALEALGSQGREGDSNEVDWSDRSATELIDHIITTHHAYLRHELPRLSGLVQKVAGVHGSTHPELNGVLLTFSTMGGELTAHMVKEEGALFPAVKGLEVGGTAVDGGSADSTTLHMLEDEHEAVGQALATIRSLTRDFVPPPGACNSYRAMLDGLNDLERDTHQHIHKENNVLFPKVAALREPATLVAS